MSNSNYSYVGYRLRDRRLALDMPVIHLAERTGIDSAVIRAIESGRTKNHSAYITAIAIELGIDRAWLFSEPAHEQNSGEIIAFNKAVRK